MKRFCYDGVLERWKVRLALWRAKRLGFRDDELDDVLQELALTLMEVEYDADHENGASEKTMLTSVIDRQLLKMRRSGDRRETLEESVSLAGDETYDDSDVKQRLDVETVVGTLGEQERRVCEMLSDGASKSVIAKELGCSWHKVDRIVQNIRGQFEEHGFGEE